MAPIDFMKSLKEKYDAAFERCQFDIEKYYNDPYSAEDVEEINQYLNEDFSALEDDIIREKVIHNARCGKPIPQAVIKLLHKIGERQNA